MSGSEILPLVVRSHAAARPTAPAIRAADGELSFAALDRAADVAAAALQASGVAPGDRVALIAPPSGEAIAVILGVLRAGAVAVPLGTRLTRREIAEAVAATSPVLIVRDPGLGLAATGLSVPDLSPVELAARSDGMEPLDVDVDPVAAAVAVLTSGTTGRPRAALLSHAALAASAAAWTAVLPPATGWLLCLGLSHVAGLGVVWRALGSGLPLHACAGFDPAAVLEILHGPDAPSHLSLVPVQLARLRDAAGEADPPGGAPRALRALLLGGAPIPAGLVRRASAAGWPVIPTYGLTEAGSGVTALRADEASGAPESAGRPLPGVALRIADAGADGMGEIQVRTPAAFGGYVARDLETAAAFTRDGWLRTGDLGRLDAAGRLFVADRRADRVISGGENVHPAEVEAILEAHPAVAEAGVAARPHAKWGAVPVAGIVLRPGRDDPGDDPLRAWCRKRLASYKVPVAFVRLPALPRTATGKLRRAELRDRLTPLVVILHATLSTGRQLAPLARDLGAAGDLRVVAPDRRGSGERRLDPPRPVAMAEHLADLEAILDEQGAGRAILVGHSFGGVTALEAAARLPARVAAVVAYEPPYGPLADERARRAFALVARATANAAAAGGTPAAARAFMKGVAGPGAWDALPARTRAFLEEEGGGAVADAGMEGLDPGALAGIGCPVTLITGSESESFYAPIADALVARIPGALRLEIAGLRHTAPITHPALIAATVRSSLGMSPAALAAPATSAAGPSASGSAADTPTPPLDAPPQTQESPA